MRLTLIQPNLTKVTFGNSVSVYFSYETPIAFNNNGRVRITSERFSNTTARHKSKIRELEQSPESVVVDPAQFQSELQIAIGK